MVVPKLSLEAQGTKQYIKVSEEHKRTQQNDRGKSETKRYGSPDEGRKYFYDALDSLESMLKSEDPKIKDAVFIVENAWYKGTMPKNLFDIQVKADAAVIKDFLMHKGISQPSNEQLNRMVLSFLRDTLAYLNQRGNVTKHLPYAYDFRDPFALEDLTNGMVSKMIVTHSGQCKSFPMYYLILVEELGGEAYLSFSPEHSFVRFPGEGGRMLNAEVTNGHVVSDEWLVNATNTKVEAIKGACYFREQSTKQVIAQCIIDLIQIYRRYYSTQSDQSGIDHFSKKGALLALYYDPDNIYASIELNNYYSAYLNYCISTLNLESDSALRANNQSREVYLKKQKLERQIKQRGYVLSTESSYTSWLKYLEENTANLEENTLFLPGPNQ